MVRRARRDLRVYAGTRVAGDAGGVVAAPLLVGAGTLNWMSAPNFTGAENNFFQLMNPLGQPFATGDIAIGAFAWRVHGNSMAWAICCALLIADLLERTLRTLRAELALTTGVVLSVLAPANETLFATMTAASPSCL